MVVIGHMVNIIQQSDTMRWRRAPIRGAMGGGGGERIEGRVLIAKIYLDTSHGPPKRF